ncbi:MAG: rhodanese-like domain-containing protein [Polaromonas sp.]|nr:rhodanese-like domain-containing protein [Polaromonas sp.]
MEFIAQNWMLFFIAIGSAFMLFLPQLQGAAGSNLTASEAVQLINREKAVVIDVCEPTEYANAHIVGAKNIPLSRLEGQLAATVKNKETPVILTCASGMRSRRAVGIAKKLGYEKAQSLSGGLGAWRSANLPIEKA